MIVRDARVRFVGFIWSSVCHKQKSKQGEREWKGGKSRERAAGGKLQEGSEEVTYCPALVLANLLQCPSSCSCWWVNSCVSMDPCSIPFPLSVSAWLISAKRGSVDSVGWLISLITGLNVSTHTAQYLLDSEPLEKSLTPIHMLSRIHCFFHLHCSTCTVNEACSGGRVNITNIKVTG